MSEKVMMLVGMAPGAAMKPQAINVRSAVIVAAVERSVISFAQSLDNIPPGCGGVFSPERNPAKPAASFNIGV